MRSTRVLVIATAVILLAATFFLVRTDGERRTVTAYLPQAVSVYPQTQVRILGVNVGEVTTVEPAGDSVRVEMAYSAEHKLPADAKAVVVKPGLVADRFVQLTPAYTDGPVMEDGAVIERPDTGVPVKLDRVYRTLQTLAQTLGPNGVNENGTLNNFLDSAAQALDGQGKLGNRALRELSRASETVGQNSDELFSTVEELAKFTEVLANNDRLVQAFLTDLSDVSQQLAGERQELRRALAEVAGAVGEVRSFVRNNRNALTQSVERLTKTAKTISSERKSLNTALRVGPVAIGNLQLAFNAESGSIGSRVTFGQNIADLDGFLCRLVQRMPTVPEPLTNLACTLFEGLVEGQQGGGSGLGLGQLRKLLENPKPASAVVGDTQSQVVPSQARFAPSSGGSLTDLAGGGSR